MSATRAQILEALSHVDDPDLKQSIVALNMVKDVEVEGSKVRFTVELTTPACPMKDAIRNACITAVHTLVSKDLEVEPNMTAQVRDAGKTEGTPLQGVAHVVAVASGKGGVGKSTIAANLAVALAKQGASVGLLDADIYGPSVPLLFGLVDAKPQLVEQNGAEKMQPLQAHGVKVMSIGFLVEADKAVVWRGPMASNALKQLVNDTAWGKLDYLIIDMPPGTGDIQITLAQQFPLSGAVVVTTPQPVAVSDARKAVGMFLAPAINVPVLGVVENMAYFSPPELPDNRYYLFGQGGGAGMAQEFQVPLLAEIPLVEAVREGADTGSPAALDVQRPDGQAFHAMAQEVARYLSIHHVAQPA